jgi:E3 ubiquitin-protein ligase TRIP12
LRRSKRKRRASFGGGTFTSKRRRTLSLSSSSPPSPTSRALSSISDPKHLHQHRTRSSHLSDFKTDYSDTQHCRHMAESKDSSNNTNTGTTATGSGVKISKDRQLEQAKDKMLSKQEKKETRASDVLKSSSDKTLEKEGAKDEQPKLSPISLDEQSLELEHSQEENADELPFGGASGESEENAKHNASLDNFSKFSPPKEFTPVTSLSKTQLQALLEDLKSDGDESRQFAALMELCNFVSVASEEALSSSRLEHFAAPLIKLLDMEHNPQMMMLAMRTVSNLLEVSTHIPHVFIRCGIVSTLYRRLQNVEYIEFAEHTIAILNKLVAAAKEPQVQLCREGLGVLLQFLDFFPLKTQIQAIDIVVHIFKNVSVGNFSSVMEIIPNLTALLQHSESNVRTKACEAFLCLVRSFVGDLTKLQQIFSLGLVTQLLQTINCFSADWGTRKIVLETLSALCCICPSLAETLLSQNIVQTLHNILVESQQSVSNHGAKLPTVRQHLSAVIMLIIELLPPLPTEVASFFERYTLSTGIDISVVMRMRTRTSGKSSGTVDTGGWRSAETEDPRQRFFIAKPQQLYHLGEQLLPTLLDLFATLFFFDIRYKCLMAITKIVYFSNATILVNLLRDLTFSRFLAELLSSDDTPLVATAIYLAENLMEKLSDIFRIYFVREGVVHEIEKLIASADESKSTIEQKSPHTDAELSPMVLTAAAGDSAPPAPLYTSLISPLTSKASTSKLSDKTEPQESEKTSKETSSVSESDNDDESLSEKKSLSSTSAATTSSTIIPRSSRGDTPARSVSVLRLNTTPIGSSSPSSLAKPLPKSSQPRPRDEYLRSWIVTHAKAFKDKYFNVPLASISNALLSQLAVLATKLTQSVESSDGDEKTLMSILQDIAALLVTTRDMSTYELLCSKLCSSLLHFFTFLPSNDITQLHRRWQRIKIFVQVFTSTTIDIDKNNTNVATATVSKSQNATALLTLVREVQKALTKEENFPANVMFGSPNILRSIKLLTKPFRFNIMRDPEQVAKREKDNLPSSLFVLVEPLATVETVEEYLVERLKGRTIETESGTENTPTEMSSMSTSNREQLSELARQQSGDDYETTTSSIEPESVELIDPNELSTSPSPSHFIFTEKKPMESKELKETQSKKSEAETEEEFPANMKRRKLKSRHSRRMRRKQQQQLAFESQTTNVTSAPQSGESHLRDSDSDSEEPEVTQREMLFTEPRVEHGAPAVPSETARKSCTDWTLLPPSQTSTSHVSNPSESDRLTISLMLNSKYLPKDMNIFRVLHQFVWSTECRNLESNLSDSPWARTYVLHYHVHDAKDPPPPHSDSTGNIEGTTETENDEPPQWFGPHERWESSFYRHFLTNVKFDTSPQTDELLNLLRILSALNRNLRHFLPRNVYKTKKIPSCEFVNSKITAKLLRQLQEPLVTCTGALPQWCKDLLVHCRFLFSHVVREQYFRTTALGVARALHTIHDQLVHQNTAEPLTRNNSGGGVIPLENALEIQLPRIPRQQVQISRDKLLPSAIKVMELVAHPENVKKILEVQYVGEVGTGLGPTLEFYTLVSQALQRKNLNLWVQPEQSSESEYVLTESGTLFPAPLRDPSTPRARSILKMFEFLGTFIAKAILDGRLLDLPLAPPFYKLMLGDSLSIDDLDYVNPSISSVMREFVALCQEKLKICSNPALNEEQKKKAISELRYRGGDVAALDLTFTLPGDDKWELKPGGSDIFVTIENLEEYVELVCRTLLIDGVAEQLRAFKRGFNKIFPLRHLRIFSVRELQRLICGESEIDEVWNRNVILENTRFEHGYSQTSKVVGYLLDVLTEFTPRQRRAFLKFVTGTPRLPVGGFKAMNPKLTIVRKDDHQPPLTPDDCLPSVNTCFYYLKLPEYSSKEVLKKKLLLAIEEGQETFSLS